MNIIESTHPIEPEIRRDIAMLFGLAKPHDLPKTRRTISEINRNMSGPRDVRKAAQQAAIKERHEKIVRAAIDQCGIYLSDVTDLGIKRGTAESDLRALLASGALVVDESEPASMSGRLYVAPEVGGEGVA